MAVAATRALGNLWHFGKDVITTSDVALRLRQTRSAASHMLARLAAAGLVRRVRRGLWSLEPEIDPLVLPEHLTAPFPAYVSFQSALQIHGMISQIPQVIHVASLSPTRRIKTTVGTFSIHRLSPSFFGGFETLEGGVRLARPEKALLDTLYLTPARSRLFAALPEVELPDTFSEQEARRWLAKVPPGLRRLAMQQRLDAILRTQRRAAMPLRARARRAGGRA